MQPNAKIIADSISPDGVRLTTMQVTCHRFVLAEMNTHRVFSRNSASSRAIPVRKQLAKVNDNPAMPLVWPAEQKGMQGGDPLSSSNEIAVQALWEIALGNAVISAECLVDLGLHKSLINRLLEPWMWHTVVITSTAWQNFFAQRCSPLAMPEIRVAAEMMRDAWEDGNPRDLSEGEWHTPYVDEGDLNMILANTESQFFDHPKKAAWGAAVKISASRCARVSYLTQDGKRDMQADLTMFDRLASANPPHWSPMEHVATPWPWNRQEGCIHFGQDSKEHKDTFQCIPLDHLPRTGNLLGWRSLRTEVETAQGQRTYS